VTLLHRGMDLDLSSLLKLKFPPEISNISILLEYTHWLKYLRDTNCRSIETPFRRDCPKPSKNGKMRCVLNAEVYLC
jgi:hypothetical protein